MPTETTRWRRAFQVAEAVLDVREAERMQAVAQACGGDEPLRQAVVGLLDPGRMAGFLDQPLASRADDLAQPTARLAEEPGTVIDRYRVVRLLGHGGMGAVYLAERTDGEYRRLVAMKVLRPGMDTAEVVRRFRIERQILANLDHPNIAPLFDGGTMPHGQPYLVVEYVDGLPLDAYCDRQRLDLRERLRLFLKVCSAVQYAHQNLVVHRDLKPANVLVTSEGEPKLLDFGIAKLLQADSSPAITRTMVGLRLMTPEYASPEQVLGDPITVATDAYALGVLLYKLLTGRLPYELHDYSDPELRRVICEQEPRRPSSVARLDSGSTGARIRSGDGAPAVDDGEQSGARRFHRQLRGDLDHIILKALRKRPGSRYCSVQQLADDIQRYLDGLPVTARRGTLAYRARKFVRRRATALAAAAALAAAGVVIVVREHTHKAEVVEERDKAREIASLLQRLFEQSDPLRAPGTLTLREVLDRAVTETDGLGAQPELQATYLATIGGVYRNMGLLDEAIPMLQRALMLRRRVHGDAHAEVGEVLDGLGEALYYAGDMKGAEDHYRQALRLRRRLLHPRHPHVAQTSSNLGTLLEDKGAYDEAERLLREAVSIYRETHGDRHLLTAGAVNNLANLLHTSGRLDEAEQMYEFALAVWRRAYGDGHAQVAVGLNNLGALRLDKEDFAGAERAHREALAIRRSALGEDHPESILSVANLGVALYFQRRYPEAEAALREAWDRRRRVLGPDAMPTATVQLNLARLFLTTSRLEEGASAASQALGILKQHLPDGNDGWTGLGESVLGACLSRMGRFQEAEPLLVRAHSVLEAKRGVRALTTRDARQWLIAHFEARGMAAEATELRRLARDRERSTPLQAASRR